MGRKRNPPAAPSLNALLGVIAESIYQWPNSKAKTPINSRDYSNNIGQNTMFAVNGALKVGFTTATRVDPLKVFQWSKRLDGAELSFLNTTGGTCSIAAANTQRIQASISLDTEVIANCGDAEKIPIADMCIKSTRFVADKPIWAIPAIMVGENGESIASTNVNGGNPIQGLKTAISGGDYRFANGAMFRSKPKDVSGTEKYEIWIHEDLKGFWNRYALYYHDREIAESALPKTCRTFYAVCGEASTTVAIQESRVTILHDESEDAFVGV